MIAGSALIAAVPFAARPFLQLSIGGIKHLSAGAVVGSFFASLLLFAPPVVLLAWSRPWPSSYAATGSHSRRDCGAHLRPLHFWQHTRHLHSGAGHDSAHRHAAQPSRGSRDRRLRRSDTVVATLASRCRCTHPALAVPPGLVKAGPGVIYEGESRYQFIEVVQQGTGANAVRYLYLNRATPCTRSGAPTRSSPVANGTCSSRCRRCSVAPRITRSCWATRVALPPRAFGVLYPQVAYDGVELDPQVTAVARRYFGLNDNPRLTVYTATRGPSCRPAANATT